MKRSLLLSALCIIAISMSYAQSSKEVISQPTYVVARRIDANGTITKEFVSDFLYADNGKLLRYEFPEYALIGNFYYSFDFLMQESVFHQGGHPFYETTNFSYENGQIRTIEHLMSQMGTSQYWLYSYYGDGRLARKDQKEEGDDDFHKHWLYDYADEGRTVIESYWTSWVPQGMLLKKKTTSQYNDEYVLQSSLAESYNEAGELTSTRITMYTYTLNGMVEKETTQILTDGEWMNTSIVEYDYDIYNRIAERIEGTWNAELGEWVDTKKITFDFSEDGRLYTVSFFKKVDEEWQWDVFNNQTVLFGSELESQQRMIGYMAYESFHGQGNVNQFEFTLEEMNKPIYMDVEESQPLSFDVYPIPGRDKLNVVASIENSVIRVYDLQGKLIMVRPFDFATEINTESLPSGIYLWEIWHNTQKQASGKWVKE